MAEMRRRGSHLSRSIAIEGASSKAFLKRYLQIKSRPSIRDPTDATFPKMVHDGPFTVTVDRFDQTVTIKSAIKLCVLHDSKHPRRVQSN